MHRRPCLDPHLLQPPPPAHSPRHFHTRPSRRPGRVASTCSLLVLECRCFGSSLMSLTMPTERYEPDKKRHAGNESSIDRSISVVKLLAGLEVGDALGRRTVPGRQAPDHAPGRGVRVPDVCDLRLARTVGSRSRLLLVREGELADCIRQGGSSWTRRDQFHTRRRECRGSASRERTMRPYLVSRVTQ